MPEFTLNTFSLLHLAVTADVVPSEANESLDQMQLDLRR